MPSGTVRSHASCPKLPSAVGRLCHSLNSSARVRYSRVRLREACVEGEEDEWIS